jgi:hypothetical protein
MKEPAGSALDHLSQLYPPPAHDLVDLAEGKTVVYVANQAGHTPETCLRHYARLFRDAPAVPVPAEVAIRQAREAVARDRAGRGADATSRSSDGLGS